MKPNAYALLGVTPNATDAELRAAYRSRARTLHPDQAGDSPEANERFLALRAAYLVLIDPLERAAYDRDPDGAGVERHLEAERREARRLRRRARLGRLYE